MFPRLLVSSLLVVCLASQLCAQDDGADLARVTSAARAAREADLSPEVRELLNASYQRAEAALERATSSARILSSVQTQQRAVEGRRDAARVVWETPSVPVQPTAGVTAEQLEADAAALEATGAAARSALEAAQAELATAEGVLREVTLQRDAVGETLGEGVVWPDPFDPLDPAQARRVADWGEQRARRVEFEVLGARVGVRELEVEIARLGRDVAQRRLDDVARDARILRAEAELRRRQEVYEALTRGELRPALVEAQLQAVQAAADVDATTRAGLVATWTEALDALRASEEHARKAQDFERQAAEAPALLASIQAELSQPPVEPRPEVGAEATPAQIEQQVVQAQAELVAARDQVEELRREQSRRSERRPWLTDQIARQRQAQRELDDLLQGEIPQGPPTDPRVARRVQLRARRKAVEQELRWYQSELACYDARAELLPRRKDRAQRRVTQAERLVAALQGLATERRRREAEQATREAERQRQEAAQRSDELRGLAELNESLAQERSGSEGLTARLEETTEELRVAREELTRLRTRAEGVRRKVDTAGLTRAMGLLLRREFDRLDDARVLRRRSVEVAQQIADTQYRVIVHEEGRDELGDVEAQVSGLEEDAQEIGRGFLTRRRDLLDALIEEENLLVQRLADLDAVTQQRLELNEAYRRYIEERILWVASVQGGWLPRPEHAVAGAVWLLDVRPIVGGLRTALPRRVLEAAGWVLLWAVLLGVRPWVRRLEKEVAETVRQRRRDRFGATLRGLGLAVVRLAPTPLALFAAGSLAGATVESPRAVAWGAGLTAAGWTWVLGGGLSRLLAPGGVGRVHFRWPDEAAKQLRRSVRVLLPVAAAAMFVLAAMDRQEEAAWNDGLGRVALLVLCGAYGVFAQRALRADGPLVRMGAPSRLRRPTAVLAGGVLAALVGLTLSGFHYTAVQLVQRVQASLGLALGIVLVRALALRWLRLARRDLAIEQAKRQAEANANASLTDSGILRAGGEADPTSGVDVEALDAQTQQLFRGLVVFLAVVGLWTIWADVLPALRRLDRIQVLPEVRTLAESEGPSFLGEAPAPVTPAPAEVEAPAEAPAEVPATPMPGPRGLMAAPPASAPAATPPGSNVLTLADVLSGLLVLVATFFAGKNVPAFLEILLLQRLPLDGGARYALSSIVRYVLVVVGVTIGLGMLGIGWSNVQWLAAALTFGLAFGLQEIFANFVSGLIILSERPIRVGDTVTVGDVDGTVTRIRIRATSITNFDRKELLIPNKEIVTGKVINWSLTDTTLRVRIPVNVAYGTDPVKVTQALVESATANAHVLAEPPPHARFMAFGTSAQEFELRIFVPSPDLFLVAKHEVLVDLTRRFAAEGIKVAFPQLDVHVERPAGAE